MCRPGSSSDCARLFAQGLPLPPWRRARSVLSKWGLVPATPPARDPPAPLASPSKRLALQPGRYHANPNPGRDSARDGAGAQGDPGAAPPMRTRGGAAGGGDVPSPACVDQLPFGLGLDELRRQRDNAVPRERGPDSARGARRSPFAAAQQVHPQERARIPLPSLGLDFEGGGGGAQYRDGCERACDAKESGKPKQRIVSLLARGLAGGQAREEAGAARGAGPADAGSVQAAARPAHPAPNPAWAAELPVVRTVRRVGRGNV